MRSPTSKTIHRLVLFFTLLSPYLPIGAYPTPSAALELLDEDGRTITAEGGVRSDGAIDFDDEWGDESASNPTYIYTSQDDPQILHLLPPRNRPLASRRNTNAGMGHFDLKGNILDWDGEGPGVIGWMRGKTGRFAGWLNPWGEGEMNLMIESDRNITVAHRPAAFPQHLLPDEGYPLTGIIKNITAFPSYNNELSSSSSSPLPPISPIYACDPIPSTMLNQDSDKHPTPTPSPNHTHIALILRGHCSFSHKVRLAQSRGAKGVIVADDVRREGERDEEGRERDGLLTMYSPDETSDIHIPSSFISRSSFLLIRDLLRDLEAEGRGHGLQVEIKADDGYDWPVTDMLLVVMLLPTILTVISLLIGRYRMMRQRQLDRAPPMVVLSLPETVWTPEEWEKEDSPPPTAKSSLPAKPQDGTSADVAGEPSSSKETSRSPSPVRASSPSPARSDSPTTTSEPIPIPLPTASSSSQPAQAIPPPKDKAATTKKRYFHGDECSICLNRFERGDKVRILPCGHLFHKTEVDNWLLDWKKLCPVCRMDVTQPPTEAALSVSASSTSTPLGSAQSPDAIPAAGGNPLIRQAQTRYARLRAMLPFQRAASGETTADVVEPEGLAAEEQEADERTSLLRRV